MELGIWLENYTSIWDILIQYNIEINIWIKNITLFITGIILGSFINVVSIRVRDGRDWVRGRSECDSCRHPLGNRDLIPVISYISTLGKCRYCGAKIDPQHIIAEMACGMLMVISNGSIITMLVLGVLLLEALFDFKNNLTLTMPIYITTIIVFVYNIVTLRQIYIESRLCIIGIALVFLLVINKLSLDKYMGLGDIDILFMTLVYGGIYYTILTLFVASIVGVIVYIIQKVLKIHTPREIPFVPYLLIGFIVVFRFGGLIWNTLSY